MLVHRLSVKRNQNPVSHELRFRRQETVLCGVVMGQACGHAFVAAWPEYAAFFVSRFMAGRSRSNRGSKARFFTTGVSSALCWVFSFAIVADMQELSKVCTVPCLLCWRKGGPRHAVRSSSMCGVRLQAQVSAALSFVYLVSGWGEVTGPIVGAYLFSW